MPKETKNDEEAHKDPTYARAQPRARMLAIKTTSSPKKNTKNMTKPHIFTRPHNYPMDVLRRIYRPPTPNPTPLNPYIDIEAKDEEGKQK